MFQQQQRPQSAGARPWTPNKPGGFHAPNGNGTNSARPQQAQLQQQQAPRAFVPPPHARQLQPQSQARPSPPQSHAPALNGNGVRASSGSKLVNFMASRGGGGDSDDDGPAVDELLSSAPLLPRTISFKKSKTAFSSSSAHAPASANGMKQNGNGIANGTAPRQPLANGLSKSPAHSSPFPRPPSHSSNNSSTNNKLSSPSAPGQLKQQQQQNGGPRPSSAPGAVPVVHSKDPNQFRWPKKYLYPSTSVSALLNWNKFDKIGCGLSNMGNTCFLNAVLQALAYTPPLANYLRRGEHSKSCRVRTAQTPDQFCLFCALEQTCNNMAAAKNSAIQPRLIVGHLRAISRSFRLGRQEDSHEFLRFVMELLQKNDLAAYGGSALVKDIRIQETTALFGIFGGYFRSQVRCLSCGYRSNTFDAFLDLSLELAHVSSISQALSSFTRPEKLDADNLYNCSQCKRKVRAEKQLTIFKAPTVLCVHLKRFQFAHQFGGKINKPIEYRERLQLGSYMSDQASNPGYSLYAVLVHSGHSIHSGHYYCYVKSSSGQWHLMDDSSVRQVGLQHVLDQRAYILFYVRTAIETLPIAAPSPGMSPAIAPAAQAAMASKIAQLNLEAASKKFATTAAMAAHANGVAAGAKLKPAAALAAAAAKPDSDEDSYSEGDSDEGEEHVPAAKAKQMPVQPKASPVAASPRPAKALVAQAESDSDPSMDEEEEEMEEDEEIDSDSASMDEALYRSSPADSARAFESRVRRHASRRTSRLNSLSLHLHPGIGGPPRFARCIYAFLHRPSATTTAGARKRRRIVEEDEDDDDEHEDEDQSDDASMSDASADAAPSPAPTPAPASASSKRAETEQSSKRQKTDKAANGQSKGAAPSTSASASASAPPAPAPAPKRFEPVYFNATNTPPSPAATPAPAPASTPSVSSAAVPAAPTAVSSSAAATPAKAASSSATPTSSPVAPRAPGPIIVSREAFDPRLLQRSYSSTQFGTSVGDWETNAQADTSAKYMMKRKQDIANSKLVPQQKKKDQWDEELDKGHVRKTKAGKSTDLSSDGYGATSGNMFQLAQNARNSKKADERAGIATPEGKGRGGKCPGGDKSKQRGAQRGFKAKGFTTHKERNAQKKSGKGRKGPRDFSA